MTKTEKHMELCKQLNDIYAKKNHDYGDSFHATYLEEGMAMARIRLSDKLNRFKSLTNWMRRRKSMEVLLPSMAPFRRKKSTKSTSSSNKKAKHTLSR